MINLGVCLLSINTRLLSILYTYKVSSQNCLSKTNLQWLEPIMPA